MKNTYIWNIKKLDTKDIGNEKNIVYSIDWDLEITDGVNSVTASGMQGVPYQEGQKIIPYEQLTEQQIIDWIVNFPAPEGVTPYFTDLENKLNRMATQQNINNPLPWSNIKN
jgi:hypothetical protein